MLFLNPWLLAGLGAVALPVIIHMARRSAAKPIDWGAMRFLIDTVAQRRRRMEWEDLLLMATRCVLLALVALAVARPFIPPDSRVPWSFVLPAALLGIAALGASFVPSSAKWRWGARLAGVGLLGATAALVWFEKQLNLRRFDTGGRKDIALVIDASASMEMKRGPSTVFERAVEEARRLVADAPRGTAFTVVLGGPAPQAVTAAPLTHRADVIGVLDSLRSLGGSFRAHDAIGVATLALSEGSAPSKEIVVFTDSQRGGWRFDQPGVWDALEEAWESLPSKPRLSVRDFGAPAPFRNVALGGFSLARSVVGTDREVSISAVVENTGGEPVTPGPVTLEVNGRRVGEKPVGLVVPGQKAGVEFRHRFPAAGPQVVSLRMDGKDDFAVDDRIERVVTVRDSLPVLLVEGHPSGSFFDRAAGYTALALAPSPGMVRDGEGRGNHLVDPRVVRAGTLRSEDFGDAKVIVLADVPRLTAELGSALADQVAAGAGLLVIAGPRAEKDFYNGWSSQDGLLLPCPLESEAADSEGMTIASATFSHEALGWWRKDSDFTASRVNRWWKTGEPREGAVMVAAFANGDTFLAARNYGRGRIMAVACPLDARGGNLAARRSFVPFVHEVIAWCAGGGVELNVEASWSPAVRLGGRSGGLTATYRRRDDPERTVALERIDPAIDFRWGHGSPDSRVPGDRFEVLWRGKIVAPVSGEYVFSCDVDDRFRVRMGDGPVWKADRGSSELGRYRMKAGEALDFEAEYEEDGGEASVRLLWAPPGEAARPVPSSAFIPLIGSRADYEVLDPRGLPRRASVRSGRRGDELLIEGPAVPGIYQVEVGKDFDALLPGIRDGRLPVAVLPDPDESRFEPWTPEDLASVQRRVDFLQPASVADLLGVLEGKGYGKQIARWLVLSGFAFLLLESTLARWVSRSRRIGEETSVDFGEIFQSKGGIR